MAWPHKDESRRGLCVQHTLLAPSGYRPCPLLFRVHYTPQPVPCCAAESCPIISAHGRARIWAAQDQGLQHDATLCVLRVLRSERAFRAALAARPLAHHTLWRTYLRHTH